MIKGISPVTQSLTELGAVVTILSIVLLLLFLYFRKLINQKSLIERLLETNKGILNNVISELHRVKEDLIEIKTTLRGGFRTRGRDDD